MKNFVIGEQHLLPERLFDKNRKEILSHLRLRMMPGRLNFTTMLGWTVIKLPRRFTICQSYLFHWNLGGAWVVSGEGVWDVDGLGLGTHIHSSTMFHNTPILKGCLGFPGGGYVSGLGRRLLIGYIYAPGVAWEISEL